MINYYQIQEKLARQIKKIMHFPFVNGMFVNWSNGFNVIPVSNSSFNAYVGYFCMQYLFAYRLDSEIPIVSHQILALY